MLTPTGTTSVSDAKPTKATKRWATLRVADSHRKRLVKIAREKRWNLNVAAQAAVEALERETRQQATQPLPA